MYNLSKCWFWVLSKYSEGWKTESRVEQSKAKQERDMSKMPDHGTLWPRNLSFWYFKMELTYLNLNDSIWNLFGPIWKILLELFWNRDHNNAYYFLSICFKEVTLSLFFLISKFCLRSQFTHLHNFKIVFKFLIALRAKQYLKQLFPHPINKYSNTE